MGRHELWAVAPVGFATQATAARLYSRLRSLLRVLTRHTAVSCARRWCVTAYASFRRRTAPVLLSSFQSMTSRTSRNSVTQARLRQERRARARGALTTSKGRSRGGGTARARLENADPRRAPARRPARASDPSQSAERRDRPSKSAARRAPGRDLRGQRARRAPDGPELRGPQTSSTKTSPHTI